MFLLYLLAAPRHPRASWSPRASAVGATLVGFVLAWSDSLRVLDETVRDTDRIGTATLNTNQNIAGTLARLGLGETPRFVLWTVACFAVLGLTVWAARRVLRGRPAESVRAFDEAPVLALICVAMFGLVVSPVSWSHHWVWVLPTVLVTTVLAYRYRNVALALISVAGFALMVWTPITLLTPHHETAASLWRQLAGGSYLWWALAVIAVAGTRWPSGVGRASRPSNNPDPDRCAAGACEQLACRPWPRGCGRRLAAVTGTAVRLAAPALP